MSLSLWRSVLVFALIALIPLESRAQQEGASSLQEQFTNGVRLLTDGRNADALRIFETILATRETPALLFNIALARRGLGQYVAGARAAERSIELLNNRPDPGRRAEYTALLEELRASFAYVRVRLEGIGARVTVDGTVLGADQLGQPIALDPTEHVFRAEGEGLIAQELRRTLRAGRENADVSLRPERIVTVTGMNITPSVAGASISVDRVQMGTGTWQGILRPGRHLVMVTAAEHQPYSTLIDLREGQVLDLEPRLDRFVPWFRHAGFWTPVGVVLGGLVVTAVTVAVSGPTDPFTGSLGVSVPARGSQ